MNRRYSKGSKRDFSDIFQDGFLRLMKAANNFDLSKVKKIFNL